MNEFLGLVFIKNTLLIDIILIPNLVNHSVHCRIFFLFFFRMTIFFRIIYNLRLSWHELINYWLRFFGFFRFLFINLRGRFFFWRLLLILYLRLLNCLFLYGRLHLLLFLNNLLLRFRLKLFFLLLLDLDRSLNNFCILRLWLSLLLNRWLNLRLK